jgi:hypothetical protein
MTLRHRAVLPFGYSADFIWRGSGLIEIQWEPDQPRIRSQRAFNGFLKAYQAERSTFLQMVATTAVHGSILIADTNGDLEVVQPAARH